MSRLVVAERLPNYQLKWVSCVPPNKRGRVSALLGPHQHALAGPYRLIQDERPMREPRRLTSKSSAIYIYIFGRNSNLRVR